MNKSSIFSLVFLIVVGIFVTAWYFNNRSQNIKPDTPPLESSDGSITYVAIGDSYTIGLGISADGRWPNVLVKHLNEAGLNVKLIANPSISGYDVSDAIIKELPQVKNLKPDFVTVLIGANDNFRETSTEVYQKDLKELLDQLQSELINPKNIVLITIPDYSKTPGGVEYEAGEEKSIGIEEYNKVIKDEAKNRDLKVADIFPLSQTMTGPEDYISDGLHPSASGYAKWEKVIFPVVLDLLKNN